MHKSEGLEHLLMCEVGCLEVSWVWTLVLKQVLLDSSAEGVASGAVCESLLLLELKGQ